jgi:uncharacterized protein YndB with AHSA1/START domain
VPQLRQQALIDAPVQVVWDLVADRNCHPEWWPTVSLGMRVFGAVAGKRYLRRWLQQSLDALEVASRDRARSSKGTT